MAYSFRILRLLVFVGYFINSISVFSSQDDVLESFCPGCPRNYPESLPTAPKKLDLSKSSSQELERSAHYLMRLVHMNCNADKITVPWNYQPIITVCAGIVSDEQFAAGIDCPGDTLREIYPPDQMRLFQNDNIRGDIYRVPLSLSTAQKKVLGLVKNKTCGELHSKPNLGRFGCQTKYAGNSQTQNFNVFNSEDMIGASKEPKTGSYANCVDCSQTINTIFANAGLKFHKTDSRASYTRSTQGLMALTKDTNSCVEKVYFSQEKSIQAGDVLIIHGTENNEYNGHSMMIDHVGEDPFGLNSIQNSAQCSSEINPANFNFSVVQSQLAKFDRMTYARYEAKEFQSIPQILSTIENWKESLPSEKAQIQISAWSQLMQNWVSFGPLFIEMAKRACYAKFSSYQVDSRTAKPSGGQEVIPGYRSLAKALDSSSMNADLIRHKGKVTGCYFDQKPNPIGHECIEDCENAN